MNYSHYELEELNRLNKEQLDQKLKFNETYHIPNEVNKICIDLKFVKFCI